jgi:4-amino-4-deoxy-L-arabinose transferase-like glycosyltransferase
MLWLFTVTTLSFLLHWPFLNLPMISDEGGYAYVAQRWLDGRGTLYDDLWVSRPQGIFLAYGAIFETIGTSVVSLRIGAWLVGVATMLLVWRFGRAWGGRKIAVLATLLFALLSASPSVEGFTANAEVFMALPAAGCALLLLRASRTGWRAFDLVSVGVLAGIATLLKPSGIVMVPVAIAFAWLVSEAEARLVVRRAAWVIAGFVAALVPALVHGYRVGWDNFVFAAVTYRITHQSTATNSVTHHVHALIELLVRIWPLAIAAVLPMAIVFWSRRDQLEGNLWPRVSTARLGIVAWSGVRPRVSPGTEGTILLRLWLLGCLAGIAIGGDWWFHYMIQITAPLALWMAAALLDARAVLSQRGRLLFGFAMAALLLFPFTVVSQGNASDVTKAIYGHPGYPDQIPVANYLKEHTSPGTPIFVAFDQAALYYLADRPAIYRYLYDEELRALPQTQDELIALIESPNRPMYIVSTRRVAPFPDRGREFWATVGQHYHLEVTISGVPIFRANFLLSRELVPFY